MRCLQVALIVFALGACDPLQITTPWCDPCPDTVYVDTCGAEQLNFNKGVEMLNDLERIDRTIGLLNDSLDLLAKYAQKVFTHGAEQPPEVRAFDKLVDARDEVRTLRGRLVSGATSLSD